MTDTRDTLPELPRTWRPLGVRLAAYFFGVILLLVTVVAGFTLNEETKAKWTPFQFGTLVVLGAMFAAVLWGMARSRVTAREEGLEVVNGYRSTTFAWDEIQDVRLAQGHPWAILDLGVDADGAAVTKSVLALQSSDGERAREAGRIIYQWVHQS